MAKKPSTVISCYAICAIAAFQMRASIRGTFCNASVATSRTEAETAKSSCTNVTADALPSSCLCFEMAVADLSTLRFYMTTPESWDRNTLDASKLAPLLASVMRKILPVREPTAPASILAFQIFDF